MYILKIDNENEMNRAMEILESNGIKVTKGSSYRVVTEEEVENIIETKYPELEENIKNEVIAIATDELYLKYNMFDEELIDDVIQRTVDFIVSEEE